MGHIFYFPSEGRHAEDFYHTGYTWDILVYQQIMITSHADLDDQGRAHL
jgi:hypothetical protein